MKKKTANDNRKKKIHLYLSKSKRNSSPHKFLTYGSLDLDKKIEVKNILNHPWNNKRVYFKDILNIKKIDALLLKKFTELLNNHFDIKKDKRYWKIILGCWLHCFVFSYYEKNLLINRVLKKNKKFVIPSFKFDKKIIPKNSGSFFADYLNSSEWNNYLYFYIFSKKKFSNVEEKGKIILSNKKIYNSYLRRKKKLFDLLKIFFFKVLNLSLLNRTSKQPIIFFDTNFSQKNNFIFALKNLSLPCYFSNKNIDSPVNYKLRNTIINKYKIKDKFYDEIFKAAILNIPRDYLENFEKIRIEIKNQNINLNPKTILTSYGLYASSIKSIYTAECVSKGTKLILAQHGGRYGNVKYFFHNDYEIDISDNFISWGKKKINKKVKNLGIIKDFEIKKKSSLNNEKILFLMMSKSRYLRGIDSEINLKELFKYYNEICPNFYSKIRKNLKSKITYRSSIYNYWSEKELLKKKCKLANIEFNRYEKKLFKVASESNISVCSGLSTTFIELMAWNLPVILLTPFKYEGYNRETLKIFKILKKNKIFFENYEDAAEFINQNSERINDWWANREVQRSRKIFLENFSIINPGLMNDIQKLVE